MIAMKSNPRRLFTPTLRKDWKALRKPFRNWQTTRPWFIPATRCPSSMASQSKITDMPFLATSADNAMNALLRARSLKFRGCRGRRLEAILAGCWRSIPRYVTDSKRLKAAKSARAKVTSSASRPPRLLICACITFLLIIIFLQIAYPYIKE